MDQIRAHILSLQRESNWYARQAEELRKTAQSWREDAASIRAIANQHNDKTGHENADYYDRRAGEIQAESERLQRRSAAKLQEAEQLKSTPLFSGLSGFWQDSSRRFTVHVIQSGPNLVMDLGNGILLNGNISGRNFSLRYQWTLEDATRHIMSETRSGPSAASDRQAALRGLVGKVVTLAGSVSENGETINASYDEGFESEADTSSRSGTSVHTGSPYKAAITLRKNHSEPRCTAQTLAIVPANRNRTRIGVGEQVTLRVTGTPENSAVPHWTINGGGSLSETSGSEITFTAGDRAGATAITARTPKGDLCSIAFSVIEPEDVFIELVPGSEYHVQGTSSAGFLGKWYVTPSDVSFEHIEIRELEALGPAVGILESANNSPHGANPIFSPMGAAVEGKGTPTAEGHMDRIKISVNQPTQERGAIAVRIPYEFRVGNGQPKQFTVVQQVMVVKDGVCSISKGGVKVSKRNEDETNTWEQFGFR